MEPVFDKPMWTFQIPPKGTEDSLVSTSVHCSGLGDEFRGVAEVIIPSEFFKYAQDVLSAQDAGEILFYLDQVGVRWYLAVSTETGEQDLWYYTEGNLPLWARRVYGI